MTVIQCDQTSAYRSLTPFQLLYAFRPPSVKTEQLQADANLSTEKHDNTDYLFYSNKNTS